MTLADNRRRALAAATLLLALLVLGFLLGTTTAASSGNPVRSGQLAVAERQAQIERAAQAVAQRDYLAAHAAAATSLARAARLAAQVALVQLLRRSTPQGRRALRARSAALTR